MSELAPASVFASFVDAILFHASKGPNDPALGLESGVLTYGQLAQAIHSATAVCEKAGLRPGSIVGVMVSDPVWHICLIGGLFRLGVASVSVAVEEIEIFPRGTLTTVLHDGSASLPPGVTATQVGPDWFTQRASSGRGDNAFLAHDLYWQHGHAECFQQLHRPGQLYLAAGRLNRAKRGGTPHGDHHLYRYHYRCQ